MPIYEYHCTACGASIERLQKMSDPLLVDCPACGKSTLNKQVSASGFALKGEGWYVTDYKKKPAADKSSAAPTAAPAPKAVEKKSTEK